jgi:hypothetical protein
MGQSNCGRTAAALALTFLGLPPAFAMDRVATDREAGWVTGARGVAANTGVDSDGVLAARPCPTRFDYFVLASFADAPSLLSLSTYHFRSEVSFSPIPLTGLLQVDYRVESGAGDCRRSQGFRRQNG